VKKNTIWRICLFLLVATGIRPVLAQNSGTASGTKTLDLNMASDEELIRALDKAGDIELVNMEDNVTEKAVAEQPASGGSGDNEYLLESRRLAKQAEDAFSEGDYDTSARLADEAARFAQQSDDYIAKMAAQQPEGPETSGTSAPLPAAYTVRPWAVSKDCFWNIAGFPWVYGNPHKWRVLYNANKSKLPDPNNPNILEPGTVLDIPSIKGEARQGAWESGKTYEPLK